MSARQVRKVLLLPRDHRSFAHILAPDNAPIEILILPEELDRYRPPNTLVVAVADTREELEDLKKLAAQHALSVKTFLSSETGKELNEWTESEETVGEFLKVVDKLTGRVSQKSKFLSLIEGLGLELFHDQHGVAYARFEVGDHKEHYPISSFPLKRWLQGQYFEVFEDAINRDAFHAALGILEGKALFEGVERPLEVRSTWHEGALWFDLADKEWRAIKVTKDGWEVVKDPPILFKRFPHQALLPTPEEGGDLRELLSFLNVQDDYGDLLLVWLICAFIPDIPRPIITFYGPQGSGKSTAGRLLKGLIDPSAVELHRPPRDENELVQMLSHHALVVFDNLDSLPAWASDSLCRAVTGGGHQKRKLYTDDEDVLYNFKRAIILNGINLPSARPDLLDRTILVSLDRIPWEQRKTERELWEELEALRSRLFGAILDALSQAMAIKPTVKLPALPRMADWAEWGCATAEALGIGGPRFLEIYSDSIKTQNEEVLAGHPVAQALLAFMEDREGWRGSPSELYEHLTQEAEKLNLAKSRGWPKTPNALTRKLNTLRVNLEEAGIFVETTRIEKSRFIYITTKKIEKCRHSRHYRHFKKNQRFSHDDIKNDIVMSGTNTVMPDDISPPHDGIGSNTVIRKPQYPCGSDDNDGNDANFFTSCGKKDTDNTCGEEKPGAQATEEGTPSSASPASEEEGAFSLIAEQEPAIPALPPAIEACLDEEAASVQLAKEAEEEERVQAILEEEAEERARIRDLLARKARYRPEKIAAEEGEMEDVEVPF